MEHDESYALMMDLLDGDITVTAQQQLDQHLLTCNDCRLEWDALAMVDSLFTQAPLIAPPAGFAGRTLLRLPNYGLRFWTAGFAYLVFFLGGLLPLIVALWFGNQIWLQPALGELGFQALGELFRVGQLLLSALIQIITNMGVLLGVYPFIPGILFLMTGSIALWFSIYQQAYSSAWNRGLSFSRSS